MSLLTTASQTVGPYVFIGVSDLVVEHIAPDGVTGERVSVQGSISDGDGKPVGDGVVEIWQADADGVYASPVDDRYRPASGTFKGFGRVLADAGGKFRFTTIKPGRVPGPEGILQAPHLVITIFMRGLLKQLSTRIYFPDVAANADDPILRLVPADRRSTLIAKAISRDNTSIQWNVVLQGPDETVFFDY
jgi:protocatechuate 3,4-dioxygenase, alpha subunit